MIPYIDMHCDTLMRAYMNRENNIWRLPELMLDISRLKEGGNRAQFFAVFMLPEAIRKNPGPECPEDGTYIKALTEIYERSIQEHPQVIAAVKTAADYEKTVSDGRIGAFLSLEDGRWVAESLNRLQWLYEKGFRMIALTWNHENCFGYPNSSEASVMQKGLKPFGRDAIACMNELGMLIDVSHLNDGGFFDVVKLSGKPFVASHSNCRALAPHPRNLSDEMIRALAEKGGVMGLNFYGPFLNGNRKDERSRISEMLRHLRHMINVGGIEVAAIGTDFDGMEGMFEIPDCAHMQQLFIAMEQEGFTIGQIEKIAYQNMERVIREVL